MRLNNYAIPLDSNAELIVGGEEVGHADQCYKRIDLLPGSSSVN